MNYIVLDLEWNQSPYGKDYGVAELPCEIIEIGAVRMDENRKVTGRFHRIIKPKVYKELHFMTKQIVHLTKEELRAGDSFVQVMDEFLAWCGDERIFCTWGNMDLLELQRNIKYFGLEELSKEPMVFYDIQKFYSILYDGGEQRRTLQSAIEELKLPQDLEFHSALNDAIYTARVVEKIDFDSVKSNYSIDCYNIPADSKHEIYATFEDHDEYISTGYELRDDLIKSKAATAIKCHICGKKCRKKLRWFSNNSKNYYALANCNEHGLIKGSLRIKVSEQGQYYAIRTTEPVDEAGAESIYQRKRDLQEKRRLRRKMNHKNLMENN